MTTRRSPDGQIYTEVPVVPTHSQLDGRDVGNQHPIEAITGLEEALASLREKDNGKAERILTELINYESEESNGI